MDDDLNVSLSAPRELRCGEYSFKVKMNPWQHPIFDENIHRLLTLLTSLRQGCGGVVYLMADDTENVTQEVFRDYKERLDKLISRKIESFPLPTNMFQVSLILGTCRSWAALLLKKSHEPPMETNEISRPITFEMDMFGKMHARFMSAPQCRSRKMERSPAYTRENLSHQTEPETSSPSVKGPATVPERSDATTISRDFSSCQRLDWTKNKKAWQKYVKLKEVRTDDMIESWPTWKPTQPMKTTPDRASLRYLFESEMDMDKTLSTVTTIGPGCAVVCRTWRFHISDNNVNEDLPPGHICDILTVTDTGRLSFWVVVDNLDEEKIHRQMEYLMITGRMLKYQVVQKGQGDDLSNLWIHCRLHPLIASHSMGKAVRHILSESQKIQEYLDGMYQGGVDFVFLQRTLTRIILSKESPLKRCFSDHTSITLSEKQLEVLMHKAKVNYITGPAGSGKSYTGASLCKMYGKERSVYICTTKEFLEYLKFNGYTGTLVLGDQDLLREIKRGTFENKVCVVIDDCHNFTCTRQSIKELFKVLKKTWDMSLFLFADNDYQSFDRRK